MWNVNDRVLDHLPRTNNDLKGWHNRFAISFNEHHSHTLKFIEGLKNDSALNHHTIAQVLAGASIPPQPWRYREFFQGNFVQHELKKDWYR